MGKQILQRLEEIVSGGDSIAEVVLTTQTLYVRSGGTTDTLLSAMNVSGFAGTVVVRRPFVKNCGKEGECEACRQDYILSCMRLWRNVEQYPGLDWRMCGIETESLAMVVFPGGRVIRVAGMISDNDDYGPPLLWEDGIPAENDPVVSRIRMVRRCSMPMTEELFDLITDLPLGISQVIFTEHDPIQIGSKNRGLAVSELRKNHESHYNFLVERGVIGFADPRHE